MLRQSCTTLPVTTRTKLLTGANSFCLGEDTQAKCALPGTYNDSFTKDLFADENLGRDNRLDIVKGTGNGGRIGCDEEVRDRVGRTIL